MDVNTISTIIGSLGFPVVACIYMAYVNAKQTEAHKEELSKITEAVNELKVAITSLVDKLNNAERNAHGNENIIQGRFSYQAI